MGQLCRTFNIASCGPPGQLETHAAGTLRAQGPCGHQVLLARVFLQCTRFSSWVGAMLSRIRRPGLWTHHNHEDRECILSCHPSISRVSTESWSVPSVTVTHMVSMCSETGGKFANHSRKSTSSLMSGAPCSISMQTEALFESSALSQASSERFLCCLVLWLFCPSWHFAAGIPTKDFWG